MFIQWFRGKTSIYNKNNGTRDENNSYFQNIDGKTSVLPYQSVFLLKLILTVPNGLEANAIGNTYCFRLDYVVTASYVKIHFCGRARNTHAQLSTSTVSKFYLRNKLFLSVFYRAIKHGSDSRCIEIQITRPSDLISSISTTTHVLLHDKTQEGIFYFF